MTIAAPKKRNTLLIVILIALSLIALGIALIMSLNYADKTDLSNNPSSSVDLPEELGKDNLSAIDQITKEATIMLSNPDAKAEDIHAYYDQKIQAALNNSDTFLAAEIIVQKLDFFEVIENNCSAAANFIGNLDLSKFSAEEQNYLASYAMSMAGDCEDSALFTKWENIYNQTRSD